MIRVSQVEEVGIIKTAGGWAWDSECVEGQLFMTSKEEDFERGLKQEKRLGAVDVGLRVKFLWESPDMLDLPAATADESAKREHEWDFGEW